MRQTRRGFLGKALALAGAAALVPTAGAAVASDGRDDFDRAYDAVQALNKSLNIPIAMVPESILGDLLDTRDRVGRGDLVPADAIEDARAEGYLRGYDQGSMRQESRQEPSLTFEEIEAGCRERGHTLVRRDDSFFHTPYPHKVLESGTSWSEREDGLVVNREMSEPEVLALAHGWLLGLHLLEPVIPRVSPHDYPIFDDATFAVGMQTHAVVAPLTFEGMAADCAQRLEETIS